MSTEQSFSLDETDRRILKELQQNPSLTMVELGEKVGLSHTPCWRRLRRMEENDVIKGKQYLLNAEAIGYEVIVFCFIKIKEHHRDALLQFEESAALLREVLQCYSISGDYDYLLRVVAKNVKDYESVVKNELLQLPHVAHINTTFALNEIKNSNILPL